MAGGELGKDGGGLEFGGRAGPLFGGEALVAASAYGSNPALLAQVFEIVSEAAVNGGEGVLLQFGLDGFEAESGDLGDRMAPFGFGLVEVAGEDEGSQGELAQAGCVEAGGCELLNAEVFGGGMGGGKEAIAQVGVVEGVGEVEGPGLIGVVEFVEKKPQANAALETIDELTRAKPLKGLRAGRVGEDGEEEVEGI